MQEIKKFLEENKCKYCRKDNPERIFELHADFPEYRLTVLGSTFDDYVIDFNFCPMCGRKL